MVDIAGAGHIGLALEATYGTYIAPVKFAPFTSESLLEDRTDPWRSPIIGKNVTMGKVEGRKSVSGSMTIELLPEVFAYFLIASRFGDNVAKTGVGPFTYTAKNGTAAKLNTTAKRSLSLSMSRAGVGFAFTGCQVTSFRFFWEDQIPMCELGIIGVAQTEDYTPGAVTVPTEQPFAAKETTVNIAASARADLDSMEINLDDNGEVRQNLSGQEASDYVKFGEFIGEASYEADFDDKSDYAIWAARTTQELIVNMAKGANQIVDVELHGAIYDAYEVAGAGSLGDLIRASASLRAVYNTAADAAATIAVTTDEDIALV